MTRAKYSIAVVASAAVLCTAHTYAQDAGPADWLECGVRVPEPEDFSTFFGFSEDPDVLRYISAVHHENGAFLLFRVDTVLGDGGELSYSEEPIGYFFPEVVEDDKQSRLLNFEINLDEAIGMIDESAEGDCDPFLCVRPACMRGDYIYRGKGYSGEFVGLNGETTFVIGRIIHCSFAPSESAGNPGEGAVGFAPDFFANNPPLNQSVIDIASWLGPRRAAEEGRINMSPDHVDGILTALMSQQPPTRRPILVPHGFKFPTGDTCTDNWLVCRDNARVTYQAEINACAGTYVGSGLALGAGVCGAAAAAGGGIGATVGLICGSPTGPGALGTATAGGAVGGVIGLCVGAVSGTVCCVEEVINGQDRCEEDALRKADLALKHCRKIYEICKLKNPVGKGGK